MDAFSLMDVWCKEKIPYFFMVDFELKTPYLFKLSELENHSNIWVQFPDYENISRNNKIEPINLGVSPLPYKEYLFQFENIFKNIHLGNSYLTNLTCENSIQTTSSLQEIFHAAKAPYKLLYQDQILCFSPEKFIQIKENKIYTFPMKGTIEASKPNAEKILLENKKETAEHYTVVDLLRNDLSQVADNVQVDKFRYVEHIQAFGGGLLQASSQISGDLKNSYKNALGSILRKMLPAGSISGAPKDYTLKLIRETETHQRNFYTGVMGVFDGNNVDSAVMIRYIEKRDNELFYKSGGGITFLSDAQEEYNEMIKKIYVPIF